jgi:putative transposase
MSFVDVHDFSVDLVLRVLGVAASTYYGWRARRANPSRRARQDAELLAVIDEIRGEGEFAATYGSPRVWLQLRRRNMRVGGKRVERIMRQNGCQGAYLPKGWKHGSARQNPNHTAAPDLLDRDFSATAPNQKWVADFKCRRRHLKSYADLRNMPTALAMVQASGSVPGGVVVMCQVRTGPLQFAMTAIRAGRPAASSWCARSAAATRCTRIGYGTPSRMVRASG